MGAAAAAQRRHQRVAIDRLPRAQPLGDVRHQGGHAVDELERWLVRGHGSEGAGESSVLEAGEEGVELTGATRQNALLLFNLLGNL